MNAKKLSALLLAAAVMAPCAAPAQAAFAAETTETADAAAATEEAAAEETAEAAAATEDAAAKTPKYVFLFIGDGMSYPQIRLPTITSTPLRTTGTTFLPARAS